jgi:putative Mn2+ efflux pump MntP
MDIELEYIGYIILILIGLGFLISFLPIRGAGKNEEDKKSNKNDKGL